MCVVFVLLGIEGVFQEFFRDSVISGGGAEDPFPLVVRASLPLVPSWWGAGVRGGYLSVTCLPSKE